MGQETPGNVALVQILVELVKVNATLMTVALVIFYVDIATASLHFQNRIIAAMTPFQVNRNIFFDREYAIIWLLFFA